MNSIFQRIDFRLLLLGVLPAFLIGILLTAYIIAARLDDLQNALDERGQALANEVAAASFYGLFANNQTALQQALQPILRRADMVSIEVYDARHRLLLHLRKPLDHPRRWLEHYTASVHEQTTLGEVSDFPDGDPARVPTPPDVIGSVDITLDRATATLHEREIVINSALFLLLGLIITASLAVALSRGITQPLNALTRAMHRLHGGERDVQVAETARNELLQLEEGFNALAREIAQSESRLQREVEQATAELQETVKEIEEKNVEIDLARRREQQANRAKSAFLANISHEIRTPMNGILGFAELLLKTPLNKDQREYTSIIRNSAGNLLGIINDLLDFSKMESGKLAIDLQPFDVRRCFENAIRPLLAEAYRKELELVLLIYHDVPNTLIGDEARIEQILVNLVGNALKFTERGEIVVRVMIEAEHEDNVTIRFSVSDTGIGIPEEIQKDLFSAFTQADKGITRRFGGTGLGLSISKSLATSMGGRIGVESTPGEGSTFHVQLPLKRPAYPTTPPRPLRGHHLLVIEGHPLSRLALQHHLNYLGARVTTLDEIDTTSKEAWADADLLLLGIDARGLHERDSETRVKQLRERIPKPILCLLGSHDRGLRERFIELGCAACLTRPPSSEQIVELVTRRAPDDTTNDGAGEPTENAQAQDFTGRRILVADDNPTNLKLLSTLLERRGAEVIAIDQGEAALEELTRRRFDAALLDLHMPGIGGIEIARWLHDAPPPSGIPPLIASTADLLQETRDAAMRAGMSGFLEKPFTERELHDLLRELIDGRRTAGATTAPAANPIYDRAQALRATGGDDALADELLQQFLGDLDRDMVALHRLAEERDWSAVRELVHRVSGAAAICGLRQMGEVLDGIRRAARDGDDARLESGLRELESQLARLENPPREA